MSTLFYSVLAFIVNALNNLYWTAVEIAERGPRSVVAEIIVPAPKKRKVVMVYTSAKKPKSYRKAGHLRIRYARKPLYGGNVSPTERIAMQSQLYRYAWRKHDAVRDSNIAIAQQIMGIMPTIVSWVAYNKMGKQYPDVEVFNNTLYLGLFRPDGLGATYMVALRPDGVLETRQNRVARIGATGLHIDQYQYSTMKRFVDSKRSDGGTPQVLTIGSHVPTTYDDSPPPPEEDYSPDEQLTLFA